MSADYDATTTPQSLVNGDMVLSASTVDAGITSDCTFTAALQPQ